MTAFTPRGGRPQVLHLCKPVVVCEPASTCAFNSKESSNSYRHVEATAVLYNICVIDFGYFDHAAAFLSSMNPALVEHVRTLHISGYKWPPVSPNSPALNAPPPDSIDAYCATWDKLCDILRGMQNLRDLRISLNNREYSEEREAKLIDEVRRIGVKGTTVIQVPPRIKPEGSGEEDLGPPPAWRYELVIGELWHEGKALFRMDRRGENGYDDRHCDSQTPEFYPRGLLFKPITRKPSFKFPPPATKPSWKSRLVAPFFICARYWRNVGHFFLPNHGPVMLTRTVTHSS